MKFNSTNALLENVRSEYDDIITDREIDILRKEVEQFKRQIGTSAIFTKFEDIGIVAGQESAESIAVNMPPNSIFIYHKMGDAVPFYPERTGLMIVTKGIDDSRVDFKFTIFDRMWHGFYDAWRGTPVLFSGWQEVVIRGNDNTITCNRLHASYLKSNGTLTMETSLEGNGKNLGWSQSKFKQVVAVDGIFDNAFYMENGVEVSIKEEVKKLRSDLNSAMNLIEKLTK